MIHDMIAEHPRATPDRTKSVAGAISACLEVVAVSTTCADACVSEGKPELERCIRVNLDVAEICGATARVLARIGTSPASPVVMGLLEICRQAAAAAAQECEQHASKMKHFEIAARVCQHCINACEQLLESRPLMTH